MSQVVFYSMGSRCGFCVMAEKMLNSEIASGEIVVVEASQANGKFQGFPSFENKKNGKTHTGLPKSKEELYQKLGVSQTRENYCSTCGKVQDHRKMDMQHQLVRPMRPPTHNNMSGAGIL